MQRLFGSLTDTPSDIFFVWPHRRLTKRAKGNVLVLLTNQLILRLVPNSVEAASAGASAFLSKPYTADRLLKALANLLSQEPTAPRSRRSFNGEATGVEDQTIGRSAPANG